MGTQIKTKVSGGRTSNSRNCSIVSIMGICPNCASQMHEQRKKLGKAVDWQVCGSCGYRELDEGSVDNEILEVFLSDDGSNFEEIMDEFIFDKEGGVADAEL